MEEHSTLDNFLCKTCGTSLARSATLGDTSWARLAPELTSWNLPDSQPYLESKNPIQTKCAAPLPVKRNVSMSVIFLWLPQPNLAEVGVEKPLKNILDIFQNKINARMSPL